MTPETGPGVPDRDLFFKLRDLFNMSSREFFVVLLFIIPNTLAAVLYRKNLLGRVVSTDMMSKLEEDIELEQLPAKDVAMLLKFTFPSAYCIKVETDGSVFAAKLLNKIHRSNYSSSIVLALQTGAAITCRSYILISMMFGDIAESLKSLPKYSSHRILCIVSSEVKNLATYLNTRHFRHAESLIVKAGDTSLGHQLEYPHYIFLPVEITGTWPLKKHGVLDFQDQAIDVGTFNCSIFSTIGPLDAYGSPSWFSGAEMEIFNEVAKSMNLRYSVVVPESTKDLPALATNNRWYSEALEDKTVNVAFGGLFVSDEITSMGMSMTLGTTQICLSYLVPRPKRLGSEWNSMFDPFAPDLWLAILLSILLNMFVLQRVAKATVKYYKWAKDIKDYRKLGKSFIQLYSILLLGSVPMSKRGQGAVRHLLSWWVFFAMVIATCFSSSLISHLTTPDYTRKIETVKEFLQRKYRWPMTFKPNFELLLNLDDFMQREWMESAEFFNSTEELLLSVSKGNRILWGASINGAFLLPVDDIPDEVLLKYEVAKGCFMRYEVAYALLRGSPYVRPINYYVRRLREGGLTEKIYSKMSEAKKFKYPYVYHVMKKSKKSGISTTEMPLNIRNLSGIFKVWVAGMIFSIVVFILEKFQRWEM